MECAVVIRSGIDGDVWELNGPHLEDFHTSWQEDVLSLTAQTHAQAVPVVVAERTLVGGGNSTTIQEEKRIFQEVGVLVGRYQPVFLTKFVAIYSGIDSRDPLNDGINLCNKAAQMGFEILYQDHCALWDQRWRENRWTGWRGSPGCQARDLAFSQELG